MTKQSVAILLAAIATLWLASCAGPHGEKPVIDRAVIQPGASPYGFSGGYVGATGGGFR